VVRTLRAGALGGRARIAEPGEDPLFAWSSSNQDGSICASSTTSHSRPTRWLLEGTGSMVRSVRIGTRTSAIHCARTNPFSEGGVTDNQPPGRVGDAVSAANEATTSWYPTVAVGRKVDPNAETEYLRYASATFFRLARVASIPDSVLALRLTRNSSPRALSRSTIRRIFQDSSTSVPLSTGRKR
jgi:hypothetical protein